MLFARVKINIFLRFCCVWLEMPGFAINRIFSMIMLLLARIRRAALAVLLDAGV
jgi:hypothetical protein